MLKKLTLRQIEVFVLAAKLGSFGDAAERLGITQPALSQAVRDLELDYGAQLFDRSTRPVTLTPLGREFMPIAERVVHAYHAARENLDNLAAGRQGRVTIGTLPALAVGFLPGALSVFAKTHPGIVIELIEGLSESVAQNVQSGVADFGLTNAAEAISMDRARDLDGEPLLQDTYSVVCPAQHPLAAKESVTWREFAAFPLIAMNPVTNVMKILQETGVPVRVNVWVANPMTIFPMVAAGLGLAALPDMMLPNLEQRQVVARPLVEPVVRRPLQLIRRRGDAPGPAARLVSEHLLRYARSMSSLELNRIPAVG